MNLKEFGRRENKIPSQIINGRILEGIIKKKYFIRGHDHSDHSLNFSIEKESFQSEDSLEKSNDVSLNKSRDDREKKKGIFDLKYNTNNITFNNIVIKDNYAEEYRFRGRDDQSDGLEKENLALKSQNKKFPLSNLQNAINKGKLSYLSRNLSKNKITPNPNNEVIQLKQKISELMQENSKLLIDKEEVVNENIIKIENNLKLRSYIKLEKLEMNKKLDSLVKENKSLKDALDRSEKENRTLARKLENSEKSENAKDQIISKLSYKLELMEDLQKNKEKDKNKFQRLGDQNTLLFKQATFGIIQNAENSSKLD